MATDTAAPTADYAAWDGRMLPYRPGPALDISPRLTLHDDADGEIDPITFEVISSKLWNINEEHADTIKRVSGSPVVVHASDFNTCIMTDSGEAFLFAPYIQYFAGASEYIIKYTLENRSDSPGIEPGDIFVHNDPFIAGSHQSDIGVYAPVFVDGRLFCWVFSACHARDIGGVEPGSLCAQAMDIYSDPTPVRAMKLVDAEHGLRRDTEDTMMRMSRVPDLLALELRSQIAGAQRAVQRVSALVERYGAATVKAAMHKLMDDTEQAVRARLRALPDGRWTDQIFVSGAVPGDRAVHRQVLAMEKRGEHLHFDNFGTDPQFGCINCGYGQFRAAIGCALAQMFAYDHRYCVGGVYRVTEIDAEVGTISAVNRDGAISSLHSQLVTIYMAAKVLSRMLYPDPEQRDRVMATSSLATCSWLVSSGLDQIGHPFATVTLDECAGGVGGFSFRDGIDQGGASFWPKIEVADCESWEQDCPVVYLYRREVPNGGHGKWRGGNGVQFAYVGHRSEFQLASAISVAASLSVQSGLFGGHWAETGSFYGGQDTRVRDEFAAGRIPSTLEELQAVGDVPLLAPKTLGMRLHDHDVAAMSAYGGGGYGDPLEREPELVATDVARGQVDGALARSLYGVVLGPDGSVDETATSEARGEVRAGRLRDASQPAQPPVAVDGELSLRLELAENLRVMATGDGTLVTACAGCDGVIAPARENYKARCPTIDGELHDVNPDIPEPSVEVDADVVLRTYVCPSCGRAIDSELTLREEPPLWDTQVDFDALEARS